MSFAHIGVHADHIHYRTKPIEDYSVVEIGWFAEDNEPPKNALARHARDLELGESVFFPYTEKTLRDLLSITSGNIVVTSDDPEILKRVFGGYRTSRNPRQKYFTVVMRDSPMGAGVALKAGQPNSHESFLHEFAARLLGYPADIGHYERGESVSPPSIYPTEWEQVPTGENTIVWQPKKK